MTDPDMEETANEFPTNGNGLPEAPVSITIRGYYKGFSVLITKRKETPDKTELENITKTIDNMVGQGFKASWADKIEPQTNGETKDEPKTKPCECGGVRTLRTGVSKEGRKWAGWLCSNKDCDPEWINLASK